MPQHPIPATTPSFGPRETEAVLEAIGNEVDDATAFIEACSPDEREDAIADYVEALKRAQESIWATSPQRITINDVLEPSLDFQVGDVTDGSEDEVIAAIPEAWRLQRLIWNVENGDLIPDDWETLADACWGAWETALDDHELEPATIRTAADVLEAWRHWVDRLYHYDNRDWQHPSIR